MMRDVITPAIVAELGEADAYRFLGQVRVKFNSDLANQMGVTAQSALQNVAWALRKRKPWSKDTDDRFIRLDLQYCCARGVIEGLEINGKGTSETTAVTNTEITRPRCNASPVARPSPAP
jgi:hypothetical protein